MKRREALKSITLSTGAVISAGTWMSLLQSCCREASLEWVPMNLTRDEAQILRSVCDRMIPKGTSVGAVEMKVPLLIDKMLGGLLSDEEAAKFKKGMALYNGQLPNSFFKLTVKEQDEELGRWLDVDPERTMQIRGLVRQTETRESAEEYYIYSFLLTARELCVRGFRESQYVGEEMLAYDPVPGVLLGCIDYSEVGAPWSL